MADTMTPLLVRKIYQVDRHTLGIDWTDGHRSRWTMAHLRRNCQCANCVDEWTREQKLDKASVPDDLTAETVDSVGLYALRIAFSDGHASGIYPFTKLRELDQA